MLDLFMFYSSIIIGTMAILAGLYVMTISIFMIAIAFDKEIELVDFIYDVHNYIMNKIDDLLSWFAKVWS